MGVLLYVCGRHSNTLQATEVISMCIAYIFSTD